LWNELDPPVFRPGRFLVTVDDGFLFTVAHDFQPTGVDTEIRQVLQVRFSALFAKGV